MGRLRHRSTGEEFELAGDTLIGRSSRCDLVLRHDSVSQTHASIRFIAGAWVVEDRNSKNGTWVDGLPSSKSAERALELGTVLRFGARDAEEWTLVDSSPPTRANAVLPTARVERYVREGELSIRSNLNLELSVGLLTYTLKARTPYVVLQALGRERLSDRAHGLGLDDEGWLDRRILAQRVNHRDVNQDIHRIRQDFQRLAVFEDPECIIEDHREQGKVRLGVSAVRVE